MPMILFGAIDKSTVLQRLQATVLSELNLFAIVILTGVIFWPVQQAYHI